MNYDEAVNYIESTPKFTKKNKPENTRELIRRLNNPERKMKIIHVAGTNGKGSVCAFLSSVLKSAGRKTGLFTSPHLVEITERFRINGEAVSHEKFAEVFTYLMQIVKGMIADGYAHPAYFELLFAAGLLIFEDEEVEYLVMETGMGGRLDATNIVEQPIACVITSISLDHTEYLGDTIAKIAAEKAGIIKEGVPVIFDGRSQDAKTVIEKRAHELHAPAYCYDSSMSKIADKTDKSIDFILDSGYDKKIQITVPYPAPYQVINSSLAMITLRVIDPDHTISDEKAAEAIKNTRWPGRMEAVMPGVFFDGAHNPDGIREFVRTIQSMTLEETPSGGGNHKKGISLLFAVSAGKDYEKMICELCSGVQLANVVVTQIKGPRAVPAEEILAVFRRYTDSPVTSKADVREAFETACGCRSDNMLFCVGSLYLIGELKKIISDEYLRGV